MQGIAPGPICPRCLTPAPAGTGCPSCGLGFETAGALVDTLGGQAREERAAQVEGFYSRNPFPGYAAADDAGSLLDRCRGAPFLAALDAAVGPSASVADIGCGTAQLAAFLALAGPRRRVLGVDGCRESLIHAEAFRSRIGLANLQLVRADLFDLPLPAAGFEVVICRGVVHHTPDPYRAIARVAGAVAEGGVLVLGFYESRGRCFHLLRQGLSRVTGRPIPVLDPILRRRDLDPEKRRVWIEDQYRHPLEQRLPLPRVVGALDRLGFAWVRTVPPLEADEALFAATPRPRSLAARRLGFLVRGLHDPDAGLVCYIARRSGAPVAAGS